MSQADIAVVGLAVMGQNLILNMNDHGFKVVAYNRTVSKVDDFLANAAKETDIMGAHTIKEMISKLKSPRIVMLMVKAGEVVDRFIEQLLPFLDQGDVIIDGGNSNFSDTERRCRELQDKNIYFVGSGVSGGEEGARFGPSLMPGGNKNAWPIIKPIFQAIAAKTNDGVPCCQWVGDGGSGHFVKMVHNGIEYGDMQLICEAYHLLKQLKNMNNDELSQTFKSWNQTELDSYLIEITANIFAYKNENGEYVVDQVLDRALQKGTGKWTGINALDLGVPLTLISESVFARCLSALKETREKAEAHYKDKHLIGKNDLFVDAVRGALLFAKVISYTQGYMLMTEAASHYHWQLNYGDIALMWRQGCIIRSAFLEHIKEAYNRNPELENLLFDDYFKSILDRELKHIRDVSAKAISNGIPAPALTSAITFFDGLITSKLPANLLQAQRDYFGAHTYERIDKPRGTYYHTDWIGSNMNISSSVYSD